MAYGSLVSELKLQVSMKHLSEHNVSFDQTWSEHLQLEKQESRNWALVLFQSYDDQWKQ